MLVRVQEAGQFDIRDKLVRLMIVTEGSIHIFHENCVYTGECKSSMVEEIQDI
jgi:hypothetical protein